MNYAEQLINNMLLGIKLHVDALTLTIIKAVMQKEVSRYEIKEVEVLPALAEDVNKYYLDLFKLKKGSRLSEQTMKCYLRSVDKLLEVVNKPLIKMTSLDIELYLNSIEKNNNETSLNNQLRNLSAFFTWARKNHFMSENPCELIENYKEVKKPIEHIKADEWDQLITGCGNVRDRALLEFLRSTAVRREELIEVRISDIDWSTGEILINGKKTKTYRYVYLDSIAMKYVKKYVSECGESLNSDAILFKGRSNEQITGAGVYKAVRRIGVRAGFDKNVYPHLIRKTTATNIVKRHGTVQDAGDYLGHKDKSTAGQFYAYKGKEHVRDIFNSYVMAV